MNYENEKISKLPVDSLGELTPRNAIKINSNENAYPPSPQVMRVLRTAKTDMLRLYPDITCNRLKSKICEHLNKSTNFHNFKLTNENVFLANGSDQVLAMIFQAFFERCEKPILIPDVTYCYDIWADISEANYKFVPNNRDFSINVKKFEDEKAKGVILANPNTIGLSLTIEQIRDLVHFYAGKGIVVIDEAYIKFSSQESAVKLVEEFDNIIVTQTFSKAYSLAGARIGYAISQKNNILALEKLKDAYSLVLINSLSVSVAEKALDSEDYYEKIIQRIKNSRNDFMEFLSHKLSYELVPSETSFVFVKHKNISGKELYEKLKDKGVYVRVFGAPKIKDYVRVTMGTEKEMKIVKSAFDELSIN